MKRVLSIIVLIAFFSCQTVFAESYKGECVNQKGKFKKCIIEFSEESSVKIFYKSKKYKDLNKEIRGNDITGLMGGEYARRRVGESVALGALVAPVLLFLLFAKKKRDQFGIEYKTADGEKKSTLIQVKKKYGMGVKTGLQSIANMVVQYEAPEEKKEKEQVAGGKSKQQQMYQRGSRGSTTSQAMEAEKVAE